MKKLFLLAASALMVLASCSKTDIVYQNETPQEIGLFSVAKKQTKAAIDGTEFKHNNMAVTAYLAAAATAGTKVFFGKTMFIEDGNTNNFKGGKYWPIENCTLNFFAIAPEETNNVETEFSTTGQATVTVSNNDVNQKDVMYAVGQGTKANSNPVNVTMTFNHALSWVDFQFKSNLAITIKEITVKDACFNGNLTVQSTNFKKTSTQAASASWNTTSKVSSYTVQGSELTLTDNASEYESYNDGVLVIPTNENTTFEIIYSYDGHDYTYEHSGCFWNLMSKKYIYKIDMQLKEIIITPSVTDWTDADNPIELI